MFRPSLAPLPDHPRSLHHSNRSRLGLQTKTQSQKAAPTTKIHRRRPSSKTFDPTKIFGAKPIKTVAAGLIGLKRQAKFLPCAFVKADYSQALLDALPALASTRSMSALRAGHSLQFPLCSSSRHQSSFLCHTIPIWNNLPSSVVSSSSLVLFQRSVRDHFAVDKYLYGLS